MDRETAQALRDLAETGRLSEDSVDNISTILDPPEKDESEEKDKSKTSGARTGGNR